MTTDISIDWKFGITEIKIIKIQKSQLSIIDTGHLGVAFVNLFICILQRSLYLVGT